MLKGGFMTDKAKFYLKYLLFGVFVTLVVFGLLWLGAAYSCWSNEGIMNGMFCEGFKYVGVCQDSLGNLVKIGEVA